MTEPLQIAVDLGAGSGRVFLGGLGAGELLLEEVRRFHYPFRESLGHLRWDFPHILAEIKAGLRDAGERARALGRPVRSLGVDGWAIDYGLIDAAGQLIEDPVAYRDDRTRDVMDQVFARVPRAEIFARTGIQFLEFNTIYQLFAHAKAGLPAHASHLLLFPDLVHFFLCGRVVTEYTNATTTQLVSAAHGGWDLEILERLGLPALLFTAIVPAGTDLGPLRPEVAEEVGLAGAHVVVPATHDTGSAVVGAPLEDGWAYISSGTWSLVGIERSAPLLDPEVARHNFSNEGGAFGTTRLLKNVMGLWILESCRQEWQARGLEVPIETLVHEAAQAPTTASASSSPTTRASSTRRACWQQSPPSSPRRDRRCRPTRRASPGSSWTRWPSAMPRSSGRWRPSAGAASRVCRSSAGGAGTSTSTR